MGFTAAKNLELLVAREASRKPQFVQQARKAKSLVDAEVSRVYSESKATVTGRYKSSIGIGRITTPGGVKDFIVYTDDPQAHIIEWGHVKRDGTWQPGKFVFSRALMRARFGG